MSTHAQPTEPEERPLGLHFVVDVLNDLPLTGEGLRDLMRIHRGPEISATDFDPDSFRRAVESVRVVFAAADDSGASAAINALLEQAPVPTELHRLDDGRWVMRPAVAPSSPACWFAVTAAFGLGLWMTERGRAAWGVCAAADCDRVFVDAGRRRPQQYCSTRCATRARVSAYRESARVHSAGPDRPTAN